MKRKTVFMLAAVVVVILLLEGTAFAEEGTVREVTDIDNLRAAIGEPSVETIILTQDINLDAGAAITINRSLTLDLGGKTISGSMSRAQRTQGLITVSGDNITVTIKNGNINTNI